MRRDEDARLFRRARGRKTEAVAAEHHGRTQSDEALALALPALRGTAAGAEAPSLVCAALATGRVPGEGVSLRVLPLSNAPLGEQGKVTLPILASAVSEPGHALSLDDDMMHSSTTTDLLPAPAHNGKTVVTVMVGVLVLSLALVYGLAKLTLLIVPGAPTSASLSGGFTQAGWVRQLRVGQDYGLILEPHHVNGILPRTVLQFIGLQSWVHLRNMYGDLGWNQCDADYKPHRVQLPGGGLGFDFGVGACEVNLNLRATRTGFHRFSVRAYVADYDRHGRLTIQRTLSGAVYRWQGVVAP